MLLGLVRPRRQAWLLGAMPEPGGVLPRVGALVEGPAFHPYLSGRANLARLDAATHRGPRTADRRESRGARAGRAPAAERKPYRQYSLGMKQRLGLAAALLQPRDLLVLDEPTNGLDPQGTREVRCSPRARRRRDHRPGQLPPARRDRAGLHPRRDHERGRLLLQGPLDVVDCLRRDASQSPSPRGTSRPQRACSRVRGLDLAVDELTVAADLVSSTPLGSRPRSSMRASTCTVSRSGGRPRGVLRELTGEGFDVAR